ncbi:hypothetical protein [Gordonia asplenii]|uniref:hypothetical protein n=1 Tax=Gordonia asplenii TaxID=2725283 RepID=UPI0028AEBC85|nr:hypothetical protein [Gordonia asplenii]
MGDRAGVDLNALRKQMAALSGRAGQRDAGSADERPVELLTVPQVLAELLPHNGIARGTVMSADGARSMIVAVIAAVSGAGGQVAVVGMPQLSMLSAEEMGADLSRIAVIDDPGPDPVEIGGILLDGMDLVVLGLGGASVPPSRAKVLAGRARKQSSVLLVTDGRWPGAQLRLSTRVTSYRRSPAPGAQRAGRMDLAPGAQRAGRMDPAPGAQRAGRMDLAHPRIGGCGYGRILGWRLQVSVEGRGQQPVTTEIDCGPGEVGVQLISVTATPTPTPLAVAN